MSPEEKNERRARKVLETFGADPRRWPEAERAVIDDAVEASAALRQVLTQEAQLDALLASHEVESGLNPQAIVRRIVTEPQRTPLATRLMTVFEQFSELMLVTRWRPALAASVTLVVGMAVGSVALETSEDWTQAEQYSFALLGEEYDS